MIGVGREAGFMELTTTTNGFWARSPAQARATCERARRAGLTSMEISWDHWHGPFIDATAVANALDACFDTGIDANLRILSSRSHTYQAALAALRPESLALASRVSCAPILPTGRAATDIPDADICDQGSLDEACHGSLNLTVNALGHVTPCCAGLDQTSVHVFGDVRRMPLAEIVSNLDQSLLARMLVFRGPGVLQAMLAESGQAATGPHHGICHLCWSIFSDERRVRALETALQRRREDSLREAIALLRATTEVHYGGA
jgi:hypothetical protein